MKKILMITLFALLGVPRVFGEDGFLYWMFTVEGDFTWHNASIVAVTKDGSGENWNYDLKIEPDGEVGGFIEGGEGAEFYTEVLNFAGTADRDKLGFLVELWLDDANATTVALSQWVSLNDLILAKSVYTDLSTDGIIPYEFIAHAIPEPCGGTLVMLGLAALALRRRRMRS